MKIMKEKLKHMEDKVRRSNKCLFYSQSHKEIMERPGEAQQTGIFRSKKQKELQVKKIKQQTSPI